MPRASPDAGRVGKASHWVQTRGGHLCLLTFLALALSLLFPRWSYAQEPGDCPVPNTYQVQPGDSLSLIAERFGTDVPTLVALNDIADPNHIEVGQVLRLPCPMRVHDQALALALTGMLSGRNLPSLAFSALESRAPHLTLWYAHARARAAWRALDLPAEIQWLPRVAKPGDTLVVRVIPRASAPITPSVRVFDVWEPLIDLGDAYQGFVPLHGMVMPGLLWVTLGVQTSQGMTRTVELPIWVEEGGFPTQEITLPPGKSSLLAADVLEQEAAYLSEVWARALGPPRWQGLFSWPVDANKWPITSPYGIRRSYNGGMVRGYHTGQDIAVPEGTPIYAPAAGVVLLAEPLQVRGNAIVVSHGAGVTTNYWHLSRIGVKPGQKVQRGDLLGWVGTTGLSTGAHLHWEMRVFGVPVNPVPWTRAPGPATAWRASK